MDGQCARARTPAGNRLAPRGVGFEFSAIRQIGERSRTAPAAGLKPDGPARDGDRHSPLSANMEGQPRRLAAPVRSGVLPATVWRSTRRPSATRRTQPARMPGLPAKQCAPQGVGIVPQVLRRPAQRSVLALGMGDGSAQSRGGAPTWVGKDGGSIMRTVKPFPSGERIETSLTHHPRRARQPVHSADNRKNEGQHLVRGPMDAWPAGVGTGLLNRRSGRVRSPPRPPICSHLSVAGSWIVDPVTGVRSPLRAPPRPGRWMRCLDS